MLFQKTSGQHSIFHKMSNVTQIERSVIYYKKAPLIKSLDACIQFTQYCWLNSFEQYFFFFVEYYPRT